MKVFKINRGAVIFETLLLIQFVFIVLFWGHVEVVRLWREKIEKLQAERIAYDGEFK